MTTKKADSMTVDAYIAAFPEDVRALLERVRETIRRAAPGAEEAISYQMPAFKLNGSLVYFAAFAKHIGFYPTASGIERFKDELAAYEWSKGAVRFPLDRPIPTDLIARIVAFRVEENLQRAETRAKKKRREGRD